jgi:uncharacterized protein with PhoU and TrkA domain
MKKLMQLLEVEKGAVELKKGTSDSDIKKYTDKGIDVQLVDPSTEKLEEEAGRKYTAEESQAVGKTLGELHIENEGVSVQAVRRGSSRRQGAKAWPTGLPACPMGRRGLWN